MSGADAKDAAKVAVPEILSLKFLKGYDAKLKDDKAWNALTAKYESFVASEASIAKANAALTEKKVKVTVVANAAEALALLTKDENLPKGSSVAAAASITLEEVGFINYLKGRTDLKNYKAEAAAAMAKGDYAAAGVARNTGMFSADRFYSSVCAVTEDGCLVSADASGSRVGPLIYGAKEVILVVGANKIVPDVAAGLKRLEEWIVPVESAHMREAYKFPGTSVNNTVVWKGAFASRFHVIIVKQSLGY